MPSDSNSAGAGAALAPDDRLDSWKEIAAYLKRDKRTVQRWHSHEDMPVQRHFHNKKSTVWASKRQLDQWMRERQPKDDPALDAAFEPEPDDENGHVGLPSEPEPGKGMNRPEPPLIVGVRNPWKRGLIVIVSAVALAAVGYPLFKRFWPAPAVAPVQKLRIAVLPFTSISDKPAEDYFSAGLTDEMITELGKAAPQRLGVIAATSSSLVQGKTIPEIGRLLNVQFVLEGSVRRSANDVRIDVQLIQVSDQTHVWAESFTRELSDILRVQAEVSEAVANQILSRLPVSLSKAMRAEGGSGSSAAAAAPFPAVPPEALDAYLKGRFYLSNRIDLQRSITALEEAVRLNPKYAQAYAGIASAYMLLGQVPNDGIAPRESKPKARKQADRALQLDPTLSEAHAVLGNVAMGYDWDLQTAEKEFQRAIALNPNDPSAHEWYAHLLIVRGRIPEALVEAQHALELDPVSPLFNTVLIETYYYAREYDRAIEQGRRVIEMYPKFFFARFWLGSAYREKKMYNEAVEEFRQARDASGEKPAMIMAYGNAQALAGNRDQARKALRQLQQLQSSRFVPALYAAGIHLGLGETDETLSLLEQAYNERIDRLIYLGVDPIADPLRREPRFQKLLANLRLSAR
jgi:TolB-like protein/Tfp pilus assembly protein PilF